MENTANWGKDNKKDGYKTEGEGLPLNKPSMKAGNESFKKNPDSLTAKEGDVPGKQFNIDEKAHLDSSHAVFVKTFSIVHHADDFPAE